ncbi:HTH-like domain-containing protein [Nitrosospira sp. Nsp14]|nr:HTH-like domain-containing protein [Nitrosospira sp. Nsp14]
MSTNRAPVIHHFCSADGEIAATRAHYGYRRVHVLLKQEGLRDNHKRVYRLYREEGQERMS